jgi:uncharacterized membrane protein HdeD (DUF308 family)
MWLTLNIRRACRLLLISGILATLAGALAIGLLVAINLIFWGVGALLAAASLRSAPVA